MDENDDTSVPNPPSESKSAVRERQSEERKALRKRHEKIRSGIPKKDRVGRQRAAEGAAEEEAELLARQKAEREECAMSDDQVSDDFASLTLSPQTTPAASDASRGLSKAARRRRKKAEQEAESQRLIEKEKSNMGPSARFLELEAIVEQLKPNKLRIHTIAADGHCLYGAIAHQMQVTGFHGLVAASVQALRDAVADYLLGNRAEFIPFIETVNGDNALYDQYCEELRNTAAWGGQVELNVLAKVLRATIEVYGADMPLVRMGEGDGGAPVFRVSFHRHYLGLGEHYNSVVPNESS